MPWTNPTATEPSLIAEATRLAYPCLTSPAASTPGMLVSNSTRCRSSGHGIVASMSVRVRTKPWPSLSTSSGSHWVRGCADQDKHHDFWLHRNGVVRGHSPDDSVSERYPRWGFDFALELGRFGAPIGAYVVLLTDQYPSTVEQQNISCGHRASRRRARPKPRATAREMALGHLALCRRSWAVVAASRGVRVPTRRRSLPPSRWSSPSSVVTSTTAGTGQRMSARVELGECPQG